MLAREVAISWKYGSGSVVDAYQIAFSVTTWMPMALVSVIGVVLVPTFVRSQAGEAEARRQFHAEANAAALVISLVAVAGSWLLLPSVATAIASALPMSTQQMAVSMTRQIAPAAGLIVLVAVLSGRLMARQRHVNTLLEAVPAVATCMLIVAWSASTTGADLIFGLLLGTAIQVVWLGALHLGDPDGLGRPRFRFTSPSWPDVYRAVGVMLVGQIVMTLMTPIEQFFAARLGEGSVAILGYANRIFALIAGFGAMAISRALLPLLADINASAQVDDARLIALRWSWVMGGAGLAVLVAGWVVTPYAVTLLFERGAFGRGDSIAVAEAVQWGLAQFPFYFAGIVLVQYLVVLGRFRALALIACANLTVKVTSTYFLASELGVNGITLATALMYLFSFACMLALVQQSAAQRAPDMSSG